ncbi:MAG: BatA domain-containing protein [Bacteroidota bacterium]
MSFVYPAFLWALSALAIPILIHLFNFRRTQRIYFSNTRFLRQVKEETTQKRKLKQYLVLASRLLFLLFLVMAFAQPFLPASEQLGSGKNKIVYLDNSFSMSVPVEEKMRALDAAVLYTQQIAEVFPPDTRFRLLTNDFAPFSNSYKTKAELLDLLAQIRLSPISRSAQEVANRLGSGSDETFWLSDFQRATWGNEEFAFDTLRQWHLVPVAGGLTSNVFVDSLYLENPFVVGGEKNAIHVRLRNSGPRRLEGMVVKLTLNGVQAATASATLEPQSDEELIFDVAGLTGLNTGVISFNDFPVSFDNEFYFTLNFSRPVRVVEVKAAAPATFVERVFGNRQLFQLRTFQSANVDYSAVAQADFVVVNGVNRIDTALGAALRTYRQQGGTLLLIPGTQPDLSGYTSLLGVAALKWLPATDLQELDKPDYNHPLFENLFEERAAQMAMPRAVKALDWGADASAILRFRTGQPYLSQVGGVYLLASPLERAFTDFYSHALFVPVMYRLAAQGRRAESKPYYFLAENTVTIQADSLYGDEPVKLMGAQEMVPPQRKEPDRVVMELPKFTMNAGFYQVLFRADTLDQIAFNMERAESVLEPWTNEDLQARYGNRHVTLFTATTATAFGDAIKERYLGTPLWKHMLVLALLFLLAEVLLIRFLK